MTDDTGLQFDQAEYTNDSGGPNACASCHQPLADQYYLANGVPICSNCQNVVGSMAAGGVNPGQAVVAIVAGLVAAIVGMGIYYGVSALTGYEIGLIGIVVGFIVGIAVRWGSGGRGGLFYQVIAVLLTYSAICLSYVAPAWSQIVESQRAYKAASIGALQQVEGSNSADATTNGPEAEYSIPDSVQLTAGEHARLLGRVYYYSLRIPFNDVGENIIGLIIIGIALFEAWKLNAPTPISVAGPYDIGRLPPAIESGASESDSA